MFRGNEGNFASFPIFSASIPQPIINEHIHLSIRNENPVIQVDIVDVIGVSTASVIQIGANRIIQAESRTKHIRQLLQRETETTEDAGSAPF
ncbi:hypothetical protein GCM10010916_28360 [Paenibacillus abyssi]|uniref:Uncharacterized protein n=1 Tax=Paenibacillus abyssi TaxID=1340531 RepID=A0A917D5P9_9BACL|nr:hypothetical protein GCM10010916_28360 [Paenibacillus abyssi]